MTGVLGRTEIRKEYALYIDGRKVLDERGIRVLAILNDVNSLLEASRLLGIAYSRVWEYIAKVERALKTDIIMVRRGGRGRNLELTKTGLTLVKYLKQHIKEMPGSIPQLYSVEIHIAGSDDPLLNNIVGILRREHKIGLLYSRIGSMRGLLSLLMGDSDIAPIHLLDIETNEYNIPYVKRLGLEGSAYLLHGYYREVGFIFRKGLNIESIEDIIKNRYRIVNRCRGSGIRLLIDHLIKEYARAVGSPYIKIIDEIEGYHDEVETHREAVDKILEGAADVTLGLRIDTRGTGLEFKPILWENFDFIINRQLLDSPQWKAFYKPFRKVVSKLIPTMEGYKLSEKFGEITEL